MILPAVSIKYQYILCAFHFATTQSSSCHRPIVQLDKGFLAHQVGTVPTYLHLPSSQSLQTVTSSSSKGHRHAATLGAQTGCLHSPEGLQPLPSHPIQSLQPHCSPRSGGSHTNRGGQMRACSSLLCTHTIFSQGTGDLHEDSGQSYSAITGDGRTLPIQSNIPGFVSV